MDGCRLWADQVARYGMQSMCAKSKDIGKQVDELVKVLETFRLG